MTTNQIIPLPDEVREALESFRPGYSPGAGLDLEVAGAGATALYPATDAEAAEATLTDLRLALEHLASDDRALWVKFACALKPLGQPGLDLWLEWSQKSTKFDMQDARRVWVSIRSSTTTYKTVFAEAMRRGWKNPASKRNSALKIGDFYAYLPKHRYIYVPDGALWPTESINGALPAQQVGEFAVKPSTWLDQFAQAHQMTWAPGEPVPLIEDKLIAQGGWSQRAGARVFNLYQAAPDLTGDATQAGPWRDHLQTIYPDEAQHIERFLAHRVQRPGEKVNHAIVLRGEQGIGKDTLLEPVKLAVGHWNWDEITPSQLLGRFNGWVKAVIVRVVEAHDLGEFDRFTLYERSKLYLAAPPDVLRVDEKNIAEHYVPNLCGVIITSNHEVGGLFLPADDRRHFVASSGATKEQFSAQYWNGLWSWYESGGYGHVAAYLRALDLSGFDAKAPPPKTEAFWRIVHSNAAPEDSELADLIDALHRPRVLTLDKLIRTARDSGNAFSGIFLFLSSRENRRVVQHRLEAAGYCAVRNQDAADGLWVIAGRRQVVYAQRGLHYREVVVEIQETLRGRGGSGR